VFYCAYGYSCFVFILTNDRVYQYSRLGKGKHRLASKSNHPHVGCTKNFKKSFSPPWIWGMLRSLSVVEIKPKVGLRRKWLGEVPFCLLTNISECDSTFRDLSLTSKAMMKPVPYFINTDSQTWIKSSKRFSEVCFITTGVTHDVSCWARFQPSTAQSRA